MSSQRFLRGERIVPYSLTAQDIILSSLYLSFSYALQLSQAYKHSLLTIASAVISEGHMKTTFPGSYFTKLHCRQDNSYGNRVQSFVLIFLSLLAAYLGQNHPAQQPRWASRHTEKDCYSICWLDSSPFNSLQGRLWL